MKKCTWSLKDSMVFNKEIKIGVVSNEIYNNLSLKIDDKIINSDKSVSNLFTINYKGIGINSDNNCNADNQILLNDVLVGKLPANGDIGKQFDESLLKEGLNKLTLIVGGYWGRTVYDKTKPHGNKFQSCDDFKISNISIKTQYNDIIIPSKIIEYKPIKPGEVGFNTYEKQYDFNNVFWIGDGYDIHDSYDNHPDPRFDIPFQVDLIFDYEKPKSNFLYTINTTEFKDSKYKVSLLNDKEVLEECNVVFDNQEPIISLNIEDNQQIQKGTIIKYNIKDKTSNIVEHFISIENLKNQNQFDTKDLELGLHSLEVYCIDEANNQSFKFINFYVVDNIKTNLINKTINCEKVNDLEYIYTIDDLTDDTIELNFETNNESYIVEVLNKDNKYVFLAIGNDKQNLQFNIPKEFNINNKVTIKVKLNIENKSDTIMWMTDQQHYTKFDDLNFVYYKMMEHAVEEYNKNNISYVINSGDTVDDTPSSIYAANQWIVANKAFNILEENFVPYGIVSGNHDVGTSVDLLDYSKYFEYFPSNRFSNKTFFGGSLNNNESHYDLITINNIDFIILYLGYGKEATDMAVAWSNHILNKYKHRNAIIVTHSYLSYTGPRDRASSAEAIYNKIVVPNNNVKMILCGHITEAHRNEVKIGDRVVHEIMGCYQFIENAKWDLEHFIGSVGECNGEGYLRTLQFTSDEMFVKTYSPITNGVNPFKEKDEFSVKLNLNQTKRQLLPKNIKIYKK